MSRPPHPPQHLPEVVFPATHFPWLLLSLLGLQLLIMWLLASISWLLVPGDTASSLCPFALWVAVVSLISSGMPLCPLSYHLCNQSSSLRSLYCKYLMWLLFPQLESLIHITFVGHPLRARLCAECTGQEALQSKEQSEKPQNVPVSAITWASSFFQRQTKDNVQDPWYVPFTAHRTSELGGASGWGRNACWLSLPPRQMLLRARGSQAQDSPASTTNVLFPPLLFKTALAKKQEESFPEYLLQQNARGELSVKANNGEKPEVPSQL